MKKIMVIIIMISLSCCKEDPTRFRKHDIIPQKKFVTILTEMHLMDALSSDFQLYTYFPLGDTIRVYDNVFKKYGITSAQFDTTISQYTRRPDLFLEIYNEVLLRLNYINDTLNKNEPKFTNEPPVFNKN